MEIYNPCGLNFKNKTLMNDKKTLTLASNERIAAAPQNSAWKFPALIKQHGL